MNTENKWIPKNADFYDSDVNSEEGIYQERYKDVLDLVVVRACVKPNNCVLDIGTGTGQLALRFSARRDCKVTGLDPSSAMLAKAAENAKNLKINNVDFILQPSSFLSIPFENNSFDAVVTTNAFHHVKPEDKLKAVSEMVRVLKNKGRIVIGDSMFINQTEMKTALEKWKDELEEEYFAIIENLKIIFHDCNLTFNAEQISTINWVTWGEKIKNLR